MRRAHRRIYQAVGGGGGEPESLNALALADGASVSYTFEEASGNIINRANPGTYEINQIHAQVTREVEAPGGPDLKAYTFVTTAQAWPNFGYARGFPAGRPSQDAYTRVAHEVVARINAVSTGKIIVHGQAFAEPVDAYKMDQTGGGDLRFHIPLSTPLINLNGSAAASLDWHHYVWQYDGTDFTVWVDGVLEASVTTGIGAANLHDSTDPGAHILNFGGGDEGSAKNCPCSIDFFASYPNMSLTAEQILDHYLASGV